MQRTMIMNLMAISALAAALVAMLAASPASAKPELGDALVAQQLQPTTPAAVDGAFERAYIRDVVVRPDDRVGVRGPGPSTSVPTVSNDGGFLGSTDALVALVGALGLGSLAMVATYTAVRQRRRHSIAI